MTSRGKDIHKLEKGWDNHVDLNPTRAPTTKHYGFQNEYMYSQPDIGFDTKVFSYEEHSPNNDNEKDFNENEKMKKTLPITSSGSKPFSAFASISATLGFKHHEGTDQDKELDIIKCILLRENIIMKLENICEKISHADILVQTTSHLEI